VDIPAQVKGRRWLTARRGATGKLTFLSLKLTFLSLKLTFLSLKLTFLRDLLYCGRPMGGGAVRQQRDISRVV
jgi:hypothetical protein